MKIEKINDNQIRCILTSEDLASHELNLMELAYGSEKAKSLFREMMQMASREFGFEANDIPIMIEAIPTSPDSIILIITKVEDPEELDTRFSKFAPGGSQNEGSSSFASLKLEGADDILNLLRKIKDVPKNTVPPSAAEPPKEEKEPEETSAPEDLTKLYCFATLNDVITTAGMIGADYQGTNSLYRHPSNNTYHLILNSSGTSPEAFNRICNTISEYAVSGKFTAGTEAFLAEHGTCIVQNEALQKLSTLTA